MKKATRFILAFMLAVAMTLTMGVSVFAADPVVSGGTEDGNATLGGDKNMVTQPQAGQPVDISKSGVRQNGTDVVEGGASTHGEYAAVENTVRIYKEIVIFNTKNDTLVYLPNITYTYEVTAANVTDNAKHITDEYKLSGTIRDGVAAAIALEDNPTVTYSATSGVSPTKDNTDPYVITGQNGVAARGYIDIAFDPTKFSKPGVYRYVITESADDREKAGVSIDKDKYLDKRYLDVYVQNKAGSTAAAPTYEIYGYALFENTSSTDNVDQEFDAKDGPLTAKSNGFVSEKFDGEAQAYDREEQDVDIYDTANIKIEKKVTGAMGDKTNEFPFEATIANSKITAPAKFSYQIVKVGGTLDTTSTSNPTKDLNATVKIGAATSEGADNLKLKDTEYVYIYGVPGKSDVDRSVDCVVTTAAVSEYNNTTDSYTVSAKYNDADVNVTPEGGSAATSVTMPAAKTATVADQNIVFTKTEEYMAVTNSMNSISPTNVVMRFGPFLFIFAAAILLLAVMRRRKARDVE